MSTCARCGATFSCGMVTGEEGAAASVGAIANVGNVGDTATMADAGRAVDAATARCWCTYLPAVVALPSEPGGACWCPTCLAAHIAAAAGRP